MNKFYGLSLLLVLFTAGCGKKKADLKKNDSKKVASLDKDLAIFTSDKEELVDNDSVNDFAFVDDADDDDKNLVASADSLEKAQKSKAKALAAATLGSNELLASADEATLDKELGFKRVQFDFNKNEIRKDQVAMVKADIEAAKKAVEQGKKVVVHGHTCQIGSASYNIALSQRRAESVKKEMVAAGLDSELVKTVGFGYEHPLIWSDKTERAEKIKELAPNRRAEVITD
jgi:outer membrane protein OmpA-like peptidoglycan-associated protein